MKHMNQDAENQGGGTDSATKNETEQNGDNKYHKTRHDSCIEDDHDPESCENCQKGAAGIKRAVDGLRENLNDVNADRRFEAIMAFGFGMQKKDGKDGRFKLQIAAGDVRKMGAMLIDVMMEDDDMAKIICGAVDAYKLMNRTGLADLARMMSGMRG